MLNRCCALSFFTQQISSHILVKTECAATGVGRMVRCATSRLQKANGAPDCAPRSLRLFRLPVPMSQARLFAQGNLVQNQIRGVAAVTIS